MIDDRLLESYAFTFYGYGRYQGPLWLVGPDERASLTAAELRERLERWHRRGQREIEDLAALGAGVWPESYGGGHRLWARLARIVAAAEAKPTAGADRSELPAGLGDAGGEHCLLALLPLPVAGEDDWPYDRISSLPYLRTREALRARVGMLRAQHIRRRIGRHKPRVVVFYGRQYLPWWQVVAGTRFVPGRSGQPMRASQGGTQYLLMRHPEAVGTTNEMLQMAGVVAGQLLHSGD